MPTKRNGFRLFRLFGIDVYLHWAWIFVALIELEMRQHTYHSQLWNALEYLTLFTIVLMHEFGHALACRSVGGRAEQIMLWPLGGVAYVDPPQRPGPLLWSIAAGPMVNVALAPVLFGFRHLATSGQIGASSDLKQYLSTIAVVNGMLLIFNLFPVYPLDGGKILHAILWPLLGRATALMIASVIGMVGSIGLLLLAVFSQSLWTGIVGAYLLSSAIRAFRFARIQRRLSSLPRHRDASCPSCNEPAIMGEFFQCECGQRIDLFATRGTCPGCGRTYGEATCYLCAHSQPLSGWWSPEVRYARALSLAHPGTPTVH